MEQSMEADEPGDREARPALARLELEVAGLCCVMCARRLERHLRALAGVESAIVNPRTGSLKVSFRPAEVSAANLSVEVRRAGFTPNGMVLELRVSGMHCASCAAAVERVLLRHPGVERVAVDLGAGMVRVDAERGATDVTSVAQAITALGYRVETIAEAGAVASEGQETPGAPRA